MRYASPWGWDKVLLSEHHKRKLTKKDEQVLQNYFDELKWEVENELKSKKKKEETFIRSR